MIKTHTCHKITLIDDDNVVSDDKEMAEIFNEYSSTCALNLDIEKDPNFLRDTTDINDPIEKAIIKYENHHSIIKINETHAITNKFSFSTVTRDDVQKIVNALDISKATAYCSVSTKILKENFDIFSNVITNIYNESTILQIFHKLKMCRH